MKNLCEVEHFALCCADERDEHILWGLCRHLFRRQNAGIASLVSGFRKEIGWTQTFLLPPQNKVSSLFTLFHMYLCIMETEELFANNHPYPVSTEGGTQAGIPGFMRSHPSWKHSCDFRAIPLSTVPFSSSLRDRPVIGGSCRRAAPMQQEAHAGFARMTFFPSNISWAHANWEVWNIC